MELAERADRLWARVIDYLAAAVVGIGMAVAIPGLHGSAALIPAVSACGLLLAGLFGYQLWLLTTEGQTVGKKAMKIKIVLTKDLSNGGFVVNVLLRGVVPGVIAMVPVVGMIFAVADPLTIFRDDRRCLHDQIAGTCVIKA